MVPRTAATQDDLRRHNRARLLRRLHEGGAASRSDLVAYSGLNRSTVGVLVSELAEVGLVTEAAGAAGQVGRPSLMVQPAAESAVVVAFDLRVERTVVALVGLGGTVLWRKEQRHKRTSYTPQTAVRNIVTLIEQALRHAPSTAAWVGVGVGVPGIVDHLDGRVRLAPNLGWADVSLGEMVRDALAAKYGYVPTVAVSNDADLGAVAEHVRGVGAAQPEPHLPVRRGRRRWRSHHRRPRHDGCRADTAARSATWWSIPTGVICRCGAQGCWETEIGRDAITRAAGMGDDQVEVADVIDGGGRGQQAGAGGHRERRGVARHRAREPGQPLQPRGHRPRRSPAPAVPARVAAPSTGGSTTRCRRCASRCAWRCRRSTATARCSAQRRRRSRTCSPTPSTCSRTRTMPSRPERMVHLAVDDVDRRRRPRRGCAGGSVDGRGPRAARALRRRSHRARHVPDGAVGRTDPRQRGAVER